jgi:predicted ATPase
VLDLRLQLNDINVLTGPNRCGKSNLYNAVFLLAKTATGGFARAIAQEGGMPSVLWAGESSSRSVGSVRKEPVRMSLGVDTDSFSCEMTRGLVKSSALSGPAFRLDPEIKEEQVRNEHHGRQKLVFFERAPGGTWIRDVSGNRVS